MRNEEEAMANISMNTQKELLEKRDQKAKAHLQQYAPIWIVDEKVMLEEEAVQFNVVFLHPHGGEGNKQVWVNRRYRYDGFNNTLYHKGQNVLDENQVLSVVENEPYIDALVANTPNSYGG